VTESVPLSVTFFQGKTSVELKHIDPSRLEVCLRASGMSEAEMAGDLRDANHQSDCRNRAMNAKSTANGAVEILFDQAKYDACVAGER
jgi:hypothetical protein